MRRSEPISALVDAHFRAGEEREDLLVEVLATLRLPQNQEHLNPALRVLAQRWSRQFNAIRERSNGREDAARERAKQAMLNLAPPAGLVLTSVVEKPDGADTGGDRGEGGES